MLCLCLTTLLLHLSLLCSLSLISICIPHAVSVSCVIIFTRYILLINICVLLNFQHVARRPFHLNFPCHYAFAYHFASMSSHLFKFLFPIYLLCLLVIYIDLVIKLYYLNHVSEWIIYCDRAVPSAVFSQPPIGQVGLSEEQVIRIIWSTTYNVFHSIFSEITIWMFEFVQAIQEYGDVDIYTANFRPLKATVSGLPDRVFMKVIVCAKTDKVLGVHMCGDDAPEIIQVCFEHWSIFFFYSQSAFKEIIVFIFFRELPLLLRLD